jgi:hypothetical protein
MTLRVREGLRELLSQVRVLKTIKRPPLFSVQGVRDGYEPPLPNRLDSLAETCIGSSYLRFLFQFLVWTTLGCLFMVFLELKQVYCLLFKELEIKQHCVPLTWCMIMFSFISCTATLVSIALDLGCSQAFTRT